MIESLYSVNLDISDYNLLILNDFMRLFIIQLTAQILFYLSRNNIELFSQVFIETTLFILSGVLVYWLVFNQLVTFQNKSNEVNQMT